MVELEAFRAYCAGMIIRARLVGERAHARSTDPWTSHYAAASIGEPAMTRRQFAVLEALSTFGNAGADYDSLVARYRALQAEDPEQFPHHTDQSIRSRCSDLRKLGLVIDTGRTVPSENGGKPCAVWRAAGVGCRSVF